MPNLNEQENDLFKEWKHDLGQQGESFVCDGAVCGETYQSTTPRFLFLLKEVNDPEGGNWDLREFLRKGGQGQTWNNVTRWTRGILALPERLAWQELENIDPEARIEALKKIAAVNIKKIPGGGAADLGGLYDFAHANDGFLRRQLDLYRPHLIVGCGADVTRVFFDAVYPDTDTRWRRSLRGQWYREFDGATYVDYYHPNYPIPANLLHYGLIDSLRELPAPLAH